MGQTTEGTWVLALQYANHRIELLEAELKLTQGIVKSFEALERSQMISVKSEPELSLFKAYKGAATKLKNFIRRNEQRDAELSDKNL